MVVPEELIQSFVQACTNELNECTLFGTSPQPISQIRQHLLQQQRSCLDRIVENWNNQSGSTTVTGNEVQAELRDLQKSSLQYKDALRRSLDDMNEAARLTFCRLVLEQATSSLDENHELTSSGTMKRSDIMEFCGLCQTAVRLPNVQQHLRDGSPLFQTKASSSSSLPTSASTIFPQKRLEMIQRRFLTALGYDPDYGTAEIQRIFFTPRPNEFSADTVLIETFSKLVSTMNAVLMNATLHTQQTIFSDQDEGGVTRVVAVHFSEKVIDAASGEEVATTGDADDAVPSGERMEQQVDEQQLASLRIAREAATLRQEILAELLSLRDEERQEKLAQAKEAVEDFGRKAMEIPPGTERVAFLRSVDPQTQRLMVMHKLWEDMVASNGGEEPVIHYQNE